MNRINSATPPKLPTEESPFKARYARWLGIVLLGLGLLNLALTLWLMLLTGEFNTGIIVGGVLTIVGFLYLTKPYFAIAPNRLTVYNLLGSPVKRYPFATFSNFYFEGNQLFIDIDPSRPTDTAPRKGEKVKIAKWLVNAADWETLKGLISLR
ncbi:MAG: hypothetical protein AAFU53_04540 [Cyanobacteria bacterium J06632_3]